MIMSIYVISLGSLLVINASVIGPSGWYRYQNGMGMSAAILFTPDNMVFDFILKEWQNGQPTLWICTNDTYTYNSSTQAITLSVIQSVCFTSLTLHFGDKSLVSFNFPSDIQITLNGASNTLTTVVSSSIVFVPGLIDGSTPTPVSDISDGPVGPYAGFFDSAISVTLTFFPSGYYDLNIAVKDIAVVWTCQFLVYKYDLPSQQVIITNSKNVCYTQAIIFWENNVAMLFSSIIKLSYDADRQTLIMINEPDFVFIKSANSTSTLLPEVTTTTTKKSPSTTINTFTTTTTQTSSNSSPTTMTSTASPIMGPIGEYSYSSSLLSSSMIFNQPTSMMSFSLSVDFRDISEQWNCIHIEYDFNVTDSSIAIDMNQDVCLKSIANYSFNNNRQNISTVMMTYDRRRDVIDLDILGASIVMSRSATLAPTSTSVSFGLLTGLYSFSVIILVSMFLVL